MFCMTFFVVLHFFVFSIFCLFVNSWYCHSTILTALTQESPIWEKYNISCECSPFNIQQRVALKFMCRRLWTFPPSLRPSLPLNLLFSGGGVQGQERPRGHADRSPHSHEGQSRAGGSGCCRRPLPGETAQSTWTTSKDVHARSPTTSTAAILNARHSPAKRRLGQLGRKFQH